MNGLLLDTISVSATTVVIILLVVVIGILLFRR